MTNLFDLAAEYREAAERLAELDLPDEVLRDTLEGLSGDLTAKATNIAAMCANWAALAAQIREAEVRMVERRRALGARTERVRAYLLDAMLYAGIQRIDSPQFALAVRSNPPSVKIDDPRQLPARYLRQPEPPPAEPDKPRIRAALAAGEDVPGARLVHGSRVEIR
jgi:hypothetical protein